MPTIGQSPVTAFGPYRLTRLIATGGMAQVYEAHRVGPRGFDKRVALKRILPQLASEPELVAMFCDEARVQASLSHPSLVQVLDFGEVNGELFLALEYVDGLSVAGFIEGVSARRMRIDLAPALFIVREVLRGLEHVHVARDEKGMPLGLVHRDVSPNNILIGSAGQVKLADFGIVRSDGPRRRAPLTSPERLKGKHGYVSPEQAQNLRVDRRSDIFSTGVVLAELLLGQPLFDGRSEFEILSMLCAGDLSRLRIYGAHIPDSVHQILETALAFAPRDRFESAAEFGRALDEVLRQTDPSFGRHDLVDYLAALGLTDLASGLRPISVPPPAIAEEERTVPGVSTGSVGPRYRLRTASGTVLGPLSAAALLEMAATGRLKDDASVAREKTDFVGPGALPEIQGLWGRHPYRFHDPLDARAARLPVEVESLAAHLFSVCLGGRTGLLVGRSRERQIRVYFENGRAIFSSSTDPSHLIGAHLTADGTVSPARLEAELGRGWVKGEPIGARLVARGLISQRALDEALTHQLSTRLARLAAMRDGSLCFVPDAKPAMPRVDSPLTALGLVARAVLSGYSPEEMGRLLVPLWHVPLAAGFCGASGSATLVDALGLKSEQCAVLHRALAGASAASLVNDAGGDRERIACVLGALFVGLVSGVLAAT